ncbi:MAG TPA: carbohydrate porin [Beijerinckiaceae bacterium]|jgi:porin
MTSKIGGALAALALCALAGTAVAQTSPSELGRGAGGQPPVGGQPETSDKPSAPQTAPPSIATSLPNPDPGGIRASLEARGVTYSLTYIGEVLGVASGGIRRGSIYQGRADLQLDADLNKLIGWEGATVHANVYQIHGRGLSRYYLANLLATSGIEALPATRLYELWLEQKFLDGKVAVRAGQLAADTEFLVSQYGALFVNGTFGWPGIAAANLPAGGPAYPLATPGVRVKLQPTDELAILAAIFNGNPSGYGPGDPQRNNRNGLEFRARDPALLVGEIQYSYNQAQDAAGLPGTVKLGAWHHLGRFDDLRFGADRLSLADPESSGLARRFRGSSGVYAALDQMVYRVPGTTDNGIGVFARLSGSPGDRNLVSFYVDGGVTFKGFIPGREDDTFGVAFGYARISDRARGFDLDAVAFSETLQPIRSSEAVIEATYQAQVLPGWTVQPDIQYVIRPGGNVANPREPNGRATKNALVLGLRTTIRY